MENIFDIEHLKKTYFKMALPVVLGMVISLIYNLADTYFIAKTNDTLLVAGVSVCAPVFTALMAFGNIFGQGGSSIISRLLGSNDKDSTERVSSFCFYGAILVGIILGILMLIFASQILTLLGCDKETLPYAKEYYYVLAIGAPFIVLNFIHSNLIRCEAMSKESMIGSAFGTILNIILDPIMIFTFHWGAFGAAVATIVGYISSDIFFVFLVHKKSKYLSLSIKQCHITKEELIQVLGVGTTAALSNLMQSLTVIVLNQYLLPYGNDKIAAMGIVLKVNMIATMIITGFAFGGVPLFGYLYGAKLKEKMNELIKFVLLFLASLSLLFTIVLSIYAPNIIQGMMNNEQIIQDGTIMLRYQLIGTIFASIVLLMTVLFQATGRIIPAFIMSLSRQGILFILVLIILNTMLGYTGILVSQAVADVISAILALSIYFFYSR